MSTLYTQGKFVLRSAANFNSFSTIQVSSTDSTSLVHLGLSGAGVVDFSSKLAARSAEIFGTAGRDNITSGDGADTLWGLGGHDTLSGGNGDDLLFGDAADTTTTGRDLLYGGAGNDILVAGAGSDQLYGGTGDDVFLIANKWPGQDSYYGGSGLDIVLVSDAFSLSLKGVIFSSLILNSAASVEYFLLDAASGNELHGTDGDNLFDLSGTTVGYTGAFGTSSPVDFDLRAGNDTFFGGDGREVVWLRDGNDRVELGNGDDHLIVTDGNLTGDRLNGGGGWDLISFQVATPGVELVFQNLDLSSGAGFEGAKFGADSIYGTGGNDVWDMTGMVFEPFHVDTGYFVAGIDLRGGNDLFKGAMTAEMVYGGGDNDTLYGNDGSDQLFAGTGIDVLYGGDGDDRLSFDDWQAGDTFDGGKGNNALSIGRDLLPGGTIATVAYDSIRWFTSAHISELSVQSDIRILGTATADAIDFSYISRLQMGSAMQLLEGNDRYTGSANGNNVDGGAGNDSLYGGAGMDALIGGAGDDLMVGGEGGDTYEVDSAGDVIVETGTQGIDTILTSLRTWTLSNLFEGLQAEGPDGLAGTGNDKDNDLMGGAGDDSLSGLGGRDRLTGASHDTLVGGTGSDTYYVDDSSVTIVELAKEGSDTIVTKAASWTLGGYVENLLLTGDGDALGVGTAAANRLEVFGTGYKTLRGLGGNDTLYTNNSDARLEGGKGDDHYFIRAGHGEIVETAQGGNDQVEVFFDVQQDSLAGQPYLSYVLPKFVEQLYLSTTYKDRDHQTSYAVVGTGNASDNHITSSSGDDTLYGLDGNDALNGDSGNDLVFGGDGNDTLYGFLSDADTLIGGVGNDTYAVSSSWLKGPGILTEDADGGFDKILTDAQYVDLDFYSNVEALDNRYHDTSGLHPGGSVVKGNSLDNILITDSGNDRLYGGHGHDTLTGGAGSDRFTFIDDGFNEFTTESSDIITDFKHGVDALVMSDWMLGSRFPGDQISSDVFKDISSGAAIDASDRLIYNRHTGNLYFDPDGSGPAARWLVAVFSNHAELTISDFTNGY